MKEMKAKARKLFAVMLSALMVLSLTSITAFAANLGTGNGSITINNATIGQSYNIYKIFDTDSTGTGNITATEAQKTFYEGQQNNPFTFDKNVAGSYNVSVTPGKSDDDVINFLQGFVTKNEGGNVTVDADFVDVVDAGTAKTAVTATVEFTDIPYGYYLVTSSLGATVTVDSTDPSVKVIDKNQAGPDWGDDPDSGKSVVAKNDVIVTGNPDKVSANYGDVIKFQVKFNTTNYDGDAQILEYTVNDELADGLDYVTDADGNLTVEVKVGNDILGVEKYTVTISETSTSSSFKIAIPWVDQDTKALYTSPNTVTVTYSAKVTNDAVIAGNGNVNKATFKYVTDKDDEGDNHESTEEKVTTYTYALGFHKIDGADKTKNLSGAEFSVKLGDTAIGAVKNSDGTYSYTTDTNATGYETTFVSDSNGLIVIKGVAAGKYTVTETKAPDGYNKLANTVEVEASMDSETTYSKMTTTYYDAAGKIVDTETTDGATVTANYAVPVAELIIENNAGTELPSTGGMGTTMLYVVGGLLIVGAGVALVVRRRMGAAE